MFNFCIDFACLSVNRVNGIGENSIFSSQLRAELHCASPIPYHVFISCDNIHSIQKCEVKMNSCIKFVLYYGVDFLLFAPFMCVFVYSVNGHITGWSPSGKYFFFFFL